MSPALAAANQRVLCSAAVQSRRCNAILQPASFTRQCGSARRLDRRRRPVAAAVTRWVVATSEHWYDDEEEFDAMTDAMTPKTVVVLVAGDSGDAEAVQRVRTWLQPLKFDHAFASHEALPAAQQVWAGRDGAPYFLKVRARKALDAAGADTGPQAAAAAAAHAAWAELLQQNWRVELDAGLGGEAPTSEALLVTVSGLMAAQLLSAAEVVDATNGKGVLPAWSVSVLQVEGTHAGDPLDWAKLGKRLVLGQVQPGSEAAGSSIVAALEAAMAATR